MQNKKFKIILVSILILLAGGHFLFLNNKNKENTETPNPYANSVIEANVFQIDDAWGYDIFIDTHVYIHQPNIPAVGGNEGFKTREDAEKVADLVIEKIKNNILPPTVSPEELRGLGI